MSDIEAAFVRAILNYDPEIGEFTWRSRVDMSPQWNGRYAGKRAGSETGTGYWRIGICGNEYLAHRLAWLFVTGRWPKEQIDHIDRDRANNRFGNLREATNAENGQNRIATRINTSGAKGVGWARGRGHNKWQAQINANGKKIHLGHFDTIEEAKAAYADAAIRLHGKFARIASQAQSDAEVNGAA